MKASLYITLFALTASISAYAIPPIPPSPIMSGPTVIRCADYNSLDSEELAELENDTSLIVSLDQDTRELCYKIH
ncbi:hypothetical protein SHI21_16250 [Bacteriovorax sp. PP10]|uniref:Uncharacterized protein n=1 Tax=Bacteriovorax antarcticus TaxID=3088717 RepID=A0ABU5VXK5_9BACT|nr:hypothetical protein [Bacteriovorax sp. PP10]MEA9357784.1 hypothetical protein [Bacteriovorax sp. PP10]